MVKDCKLEPNEKPGKALGIEELESAGNKELNNGKPTEEELGDNEDGPNIDNDDDGTLDGADDNEYKGTIELFNGVTDKLYGNNEGATNDELKGNNALVNI